MLKYLGQRLNSPPPPPAIRLVEGGHDIRLGVSGREGRGGGPSPTGGMGGSVGARSGRAAVHDSSSGGTLEEGRGSVYIYLSKVK